MPKNTGFRNFLANSLRIGQYPKLNDPKELEKLKKKMSPLTSEELTKSIEACKLCAEEIRNYKKKKSALKFIQEVELIIKDFTSARAKEIENQKAIFEKAIFENTGNPYKKQKQLERLEIINLISKLKTYYENHEDDKKISRDLENPNSELSKIIKLIMKPRSTYISLYNTGYKEINQILKWCLFIHRILEYAIQHHQAYYNLKIWKDRIIMYEELKKPYSKTNIVPFNVIKAINDKFPPLQKEKIYKAQVIQLTPETYNYSVGIQIEGTYYRIVTPAQKTNNVARKLIEKEEDRKRIEEDRNEGIIALFEENQNKMLKIIDLGGEDYSLQLGWWEGITTHDQVCVLIRETHFVKVGKQPFHLVIPNDDQDTEPPNVNRILLGKAIEPMLVLRWLSSEDSDDGI